MVRAWRKAEIRQFEVIEAKNEVAIANIKLYVNREEAL